MKIIRSKEFLDNVVVVDIHGHDHQKAIDGYQIDWTVLAKYRIFNITFQSKERLDNMMAYNGYEVELATIYGYDGDESQEFISFCLEHEIEGYEEFLKHLKKASQELSKLELNNRIHEEESEG